MSKRAKNIEVIMKHQDVWHLCRQKQMQSCLLLFVFILKFLVRRLDNFFFIKIITHSYDSIG